MTPSKNPLIAIVDAFRSPIDCFAAAHERPKWAWLAYLLIMFSPMMLWGAYFNNVDLSWLQQMLTQHLNLTDVAPDVRDAWLTKEVLLAGEVFNDIAGRTAALFILALWLNLATKSSQYPIGFAKWLAASCFIMLPSVIGDLASYINVMFNPAQILPNAADLNSLNGLLKLSPNHPWAMFSSTVPLLTPWYIALTYAAVSAWTDFDRARAIVTAALHWALVLIVWPLMIAAA